jgi:CRISPR/Cas system CMR-associated protein Cmr3 (group 5 of RAMP superfamily)
MILSPFNLWPLAAIRTGRGFAKRSPKQIYMNIYTNVYKYIHIKKEVSLPHPVLTTKAFIDHSSITTTLMD